MNNAIKVIGLCGSPHQNGNTTKLIRKVLEGAQSMGAEIEFISLGNKKILFCTACYKCLKEGTCVLKDDLNELREKMMKSDGLVIGSPTYNREITGQLKAFYDRLWYDIHKQAFVGKYAICINTYIINSGCSQKTLRDLTMALGYYVVEMIDANLLRFGNEIERDDKTMKKAFDAGLRLVKDIKAERRFLRQDLIRKFFIKPVFRKIDKLMGEKGLL